MARQERGLTGRLHIMPTKGEGTNSDGKSYSWRVAGFGNREGRWYKDRAPSDDTMRKNKANPDWQMLIEAKDKRTGSVTNFMIFGGYEPEDLPDIIDLQMENY